ncbi:MAG: 16S rRNA (cytosine(1402)-N(4))-methyltransferase RsmH [Parcubacteria group bacterium]|jgi:16S rRNA (cytosine1402-N4)-methyltransferase
MKVSHKSVLLNESVAGLNLKVGSVAVDATLGGGGHSNAILKIIGESGRLIAIDQDAAAVEDFKKYLESKIGNSDFLPIGRQVVKDNFSNLGEILGAQGINSVDGILADLGYSSIQLEDASYGMSFLQDAELDMRLDKDGKLTAQKIVNEYSQADLGRIIKNYGEERFANSIARKIVELRKAKAIETTFELVEAISQAVPEKYKHAKTHFATRTFQALRIEVNQELKNLEKFIPAAMEKLSAGGRLAIISFHSLEDRIVKNIFRENARGCICPPSFPKCQCDHVAKMKVITKKPITPSDAEILGNPRARSAKLRICEKV